LLASHIIVRECRDVRLAATGQTKTENAASRSGRGDHPDILTSAAGYNDALMKFLFDLFPVILFFAAYKLAGIYVATGVAIGATFAQIGWLLLRKRRIDAMLWVSLGIIVVFGGATLVLQSEAFIKWKPTVLYWLFAVILFGGQLAGKNFMRSMLSEQVQLPDAAWLRLNMSWAGFFAAMGFVNLYVAFSYSTDTWVSFKLFGFTGLMLLFVVGQAFFLARHIEEDPGKP